MQNVPLCIDLDGTFLQTDSLHEGLVILAKQNPILLLNLPFWWMRGRAYLKRQITKRAKFDAAKLPVNRPFLDYLESEHRAGRHLILVTAADEAVAQAVSDRFPIFKSYVSSNGDRNLSGREKANILEERFGRGNFDYAGNASIDLPVWMAARRAIVVNAGARTTREANKVARVERVFETPRRENLVAAFRALRVHQWAKNLLLFVPLFGAHKWNDPQRIKSVLVAFVCFCLCASSVYILNDLFDLAADRHHPTKRARPFASGQLSIRSGVFIWLGLAIGAFSIAILTLPTVFVIAFASYYLLTLCYSFRLKQIGLLDVFVLTSLYGIRILAGGFAAQVSVSDWLLVLSLFLFLSLAFVKRFTELAFMVSPGAGQVMGRGYSFADNEIISQMGVASGYIAVVILALYVTNPAVTQLYRHPVNLLFACPLLLYWISRVWLLARRSDLHEDPVVFAVTDRQSWLIGLGLILVVLMSGPR